MPYVIVSAGRFDCAGAHVIGPDSNDPQVFATRAEAKLRKAEVLDSTPSKYLPLVIRAVDACPRCGQISDSSDVCQPCWALERAPQGESVRLFAPAPTQLDGQLSF